MAKKTRNQDAGIPKTLRGLLDDFGRKDGAPDFYKIERTNAVFSDSVTHAYVTVETFPDSDIERNPANAHASVRIASAGLYFCNQPKANEITFEADREVLYVLAVALFRAATNVARHHTALAQP